MTVCTFSLYICVATTCTRLIQIANSTFNKIKSISETNAAHMIRIRHMLKRLILAIRQEKNHSQKAKSLI